MLIARLKWGWKQHGQDVHSASTPYTQVATTQSDRQAPATPNLGTRKRQTCRVTALNQTRVRWTTFRQHG